MPRDATETRARLLDEAERLFALHGIHQATTREITVAAGQRNASALTYHFGSRSGLLLEILRRHGDPLDRQRSELLTEPLEEQPTRALVGALLIPYAGCLDTSGGRHYVRIVAQLTDQFPVWRVESEVTPPHLRRILATLEGRAAQAARGVGPAIGAGAGMTARPGQGIRVASRAPTARVPAIARQRVVAAIMLMTTATADRAHLIEAGAPLELAHEEFVALMADMLVAGLEAAVGAPVTTLAARPAGRLRVDRGGRVRRQ
jgi:AcrR family transcriptional regulator